MRKKYRDVVHNPRVAFVIDDLPSVNPWTVREIEIRGQAQVLTTGRKEQGPGFDPEMFRIRPSRIISWGINSKDFTQLNRMSVPRRDARTYWHRRYAAKPLVVCAVRVFRKPDEDPNGWQMRRQTTTLLLLSGRTAVLLRTEGSAYFGMITTEPICDCQRPCPANVNSNLRECRFWRWKHQSRTKVGKAKIAIGKYANTAQTQCRRRFRTGRPAPIRQVQSNPPHDDSFGAGSV
jgi:hypothetical protein